jgi:plastocyanin
MKLSAALPKVAPAIACLALATVAWSGEVKGKVTAVGMRSPEGIAVYIDAVPGKTFPAPAQHVTMDQTHLAFAPHALVVQQGTTVDFKNDDSVGHNVYWPAVSHNRKLAHNMGTWPQGQSKPFTFSDVGEVPLLCNVHPEMSGYIIVVPTPYFALTDKDGNFLIKNVPPGQYTLKTSSEGGKPASQDVTVANGTVSVSLTVSK